MAAGPQGSIAWHASLAAMAADGWIVWLLLGFLMGGFDLFTRRSKRGDGS